MEQGPEQPLEDLKSPSSSTAASSALLDAHVGSSLSRMGSLANDLSCLSLHDLPAIERSKSQSSSDDRFQDMGLASSHDRNMDSEIPSDDSPSYGSDQDTVVESGDDFDVGHPTVIDCIMKSFCASLDSKLALAKASESSRKADGRVKERAQVLNVEESSHSNDEEVKEEEEHGNAQFNREPSVAQEMLGKSDTEEPAMRAARIKKCSLSSMSMVSLLASRSERTPKEADTTAPCSALPQPAPTHTSFPSSVLRRKLRRKRHKELQEDDSEIPETAGQAVAAALVPPPPPPPPPLPCPIMAPCPAFNEPPRPIETPSFQPTSVYSHESVVHPLWEETQRVGGGVWRGAEGRRLLSGPAAASPGAPPRMAEPDLPAARLVEQGEEIIPSGSTARPIAECMNTEIQPPTYAYYIPIPAAPISPLGSSFNTLRQPGIPLPEGMAMTSFSSPPASSISDHATISSHNFERHESSSAESTLREASGQAQAGKGAKRTAEPDHDVNRRVPGPVEETDGDGRRKKIKNTGVKPGLSRTGGNKKFACPYFKRNPKKYRNWTSCPGPGWDEVHRVKTHLYRRHQLPIQCPRCWLVFKSDGELQGHIQQDPPCQKQEKQTLQDGFTKDQEKKLRSRKKTHAEMNDEDKWREIYMILFPDDDHSIIPAPYYDDSDNSETPGFAGSEEFEDYVTFVRREMPTLVRRELEVLFRDHFSDVEERLRPRIAQMVLELQPKLLDLYKQSQMPLSEYGPRQHERRAPGSEPAATPVHSQPTDSATGSEFQSTPDLASGTTSPASATNQRSVPFGSQSFSMDTGNPYVTALNHVPAEPSDFNTGLGLDWDDEFDKLLSPALFMSPLSETQLAQGFITPAL
ncbi:hypothetical protein VTJ83DRAFT_4117 [Remersonia thermophila]|uniref:C2H2-type domain-containing protein n=1 Tax=Remersonia thermophila TaxID=72144 RepID=A0ABR4D945_9PEZI